MLNKSNTRSEVRASSENLLTKFAFLGWILAIITIQWIMYGPYGPLVKAFIGYQTVIRAQDFLLQFLSARSVFE